jgi:LPXTG-motif cell wall-anchored protein
VALLPTGASAPAQLARTGPADMQPLTTLGLGLVVAGGAALLLGRARREDDELVPAPFAHPQVGLGDRGTTSTSTPRRVVVLDD